LKFAGRGRAEEVFCKDADSVCDREKCNSLFPSAMAEEAPRRKRRRANRPAPAEEEEDQAVEAGDVRGPLGKTLRDKEEVVNVVRLHVSNSLLVSCANSNNISSFHKQKNKQSDVDLEALLGALSMDEVVALWESWHLFVAEESLTLMQRNDDDEEEEEPRELSLVKFLLLLPTHMMRPFTTVRRRLLADP
jgi:hypothetical protein